MEVFIELSDIREKYDIDGKVNVLVWSILGGAITWKIFKKLKQAYNLRKKLSSFPKNERFEWFFGSKRFYDFQIVPRGDRLEMWKNQQNLVNSRKGAGVETRNRGLILTWFTG